MSAQTASLALILLSAAAVLYSPLGRRPFLQIAAMLGTMAVEIFSLTAMESYAAGNPPFTNPAWLTAPAWLVFASAGAGFVLLASRSSVSLLRLWFFGIENGGNVPVTRDEKHAFAVLIAVGAAAFAGGIAFLRFETRSQGAKALEALKTTSVLKIEQVEHWRTERFADADSMARIPLLADMLHSEFSGAADPRLDELGDWARAFVKGYGYAGLVLFDPAMKPVFSYPRKPDFELPALRDQLKVPSDPTKVVELTPYADATGAFRWDLLIPLHGYKKTEIEGVVLLQTDPARYINPVLESWPVEYRTGQTVLWYREGDHLVSLGGMRPAPGLSAEEIRPFGSVRDRSKTVPGSIGILIFGSEIVSAEGLDRIGTPIIGVGGPVRDSKWVFSSRVDSTDVYVGVRRDAVWISGLIAGLFVSTGFVTGRLSRQRQHTQKELSDRELRASEERYRMIAENTSDVIWLYDLKKDAYVYISPSVFALRGFTPDEVLGHKLTEFVAPEAVRRINEAVEASVAPWDGNGKQAAHTVMEVDLVHKNGTHIRTEIVATVLRDPAGRAERILGITRDISERLKARQAQDAMAGLERERKLSAMKSQFLSVASHEFRTPLAAAVGSLELMERHGAKLADAKRQEIMGRAQRSLARLTVIMNDVLQVSRADSGRMKVSRMDVDIPRFVQDVVTEVESGDKQQHRLEFRKVGAPEIGPVDTNLVHHIVSNLISNAVRYSPAGTAIALTLALNEAGFSIAVADEGIGIPEAEREHIFEPFARGSNVGKIAGTGLGLNIVKRYTELMGGSIALLPTASGTTFQVTIPFKPPST